FYQNTAISNLVDDYVSGYHQKDESGEEKLLQGRLALFRNFDETTGNPLARPHTLLIDSEELESGEALDDRFRAMAADEIERFRRDIVERTGNAQAAETITDQELLREVMNTVGKKDQLGAGIRCVVSVSMLTEGWDANNVTHILGIRAFQRAAQARPHTLQSSGVGGGSPLTLRAWRLHLLEPGSWVRDIPTTRWPTPPKGSGRRLSSVDVRSPRNQHTIT